MKFSYSFSRVMRTVIWGCSLIGASVSFDVGVSIFGGEPMHYTDDGETISYAVSSARRDLGFTRQILSSDADQGDFGATVLVEKLRTILEAGDASLKDVLRLNVHLANAKSDLRGAAEKMIADHWPAGQTPAVTFIPGLFPGGVPMACDAVFVLPNCGQEVYPITQSAANSPVRVDAVVAPAKRDLIFVSGCAVDGATYAESILPTVDQILNVHLFPHGVQLSDVVQVRAYVGDLDNWAVAEAMINSRFVDLPPPPIVFVEWANRDSVEIEFIAAASSAADTDQGVSFFTPQTLVASPLYSRVAIVHSQEIIYFSGMLGTTNQSPTAQVTSVFDNLKRRTEAVGSDLRNLVKATYLVSDREVDQAVNALRPNYYDPTRPPAASKIFRTSVGAIDRDLLVDMIAVPARDDTKTATDR